ncbi:hypothetical protein E1H12_02745 [Geitlerinema sp. P-1104]|uniref:hypothetical protein n=1 Tax=Geitlerinema sp. P-1104 TaxID=2546230 RepID=UPI0014770335|nr:hypothetical protein [Geitlerinema sp. P-1104]NMG57464.1 hypothetical protein [Geitlerinema sp. P-1104]
MEQWDFLIQREGDRVWLPLAEGQTRLSPGRYRVVARSQARETLTEVCVRYEPPSESDEAGQFYRSTRQTNNEGTVLVLPATDLKVGIWSLSCSLAALRRDRPDAPPQGRVGLHVRPDIESHPEPPVAEIPESGTTRDLTEELAPIAESHSPEPQALDLRLELAQENYRLQAGEALVLSGRIHAVSDESAPLCGLHLRIRLREPQSLHVVTTLQRLLPRETGSIDFSYPVTIPESCHSRLILGEVVLCNAVPTVLAKQSFVVTARLETLLDELADGQIDRSLIERSQPQSQPRHRPLPPPASSDASSLNSEPPQLDKALPPRLNLGKSPRPKPLDLPSFGKPLPEAMENPFGELQQPSTPELPIQEPLTPAPRDDVELDAALDSQSNDSLGHNSLEAANPSPDPSSEAIAPSLEADLAPSRFSSRLNDIANNEDLSEWLTARAEQAHETNPFTLGSEFESSLEEASEVVVDDEPRVAPPPVPQLAASPSPENPVPTPELIVPTHTLAVGRPALIRVRLQETPQRVYVKLWIHDRQNQLLLDGPRWLTDFFPVEDGLLESMIRLTIPKGGVDLQFEAIAVDMESERESYKVAIARRVAPPGLPSLPLTGKSDS